MRTSIALGLLFAAAGSLSAQVIRTNAGFHSQSVARNDDGSSDVAQLGFTINFFGKLRSSVWVNNNGNLTFDDSLATYTPFGLDKTSREIIAPFFADVDTRGPKSALVTYGNDKVNGHNAFAANYIDVGYFASHDDKLNRFQVVVIDRSDTGPGNFTIEFNYERILWETGDASGGVGGFGGVPVTVGWSNGTGDPGTSFELPGSMISGAFLNSGSRALIRAHLNTSQVGRLLFQARDGVISPGLAIQGGPVLPDGTIGESYSFGFTTTGVDGAIKWDFVPDLTMPPGLQFSNGLLTGRPTATGTYSFTVSASAVVEGEAVTIYSRGAVTIGVPKLGIRTSCPVPAATVGQLYSTSFAASGPGSVLWSVNDRNSLPPGLTLSATGLLTGAPAAAGIYNFVVHVAPGDGSGTLPAEKNCRLTVNPATVSLIYGCTMPGGTVGVPYSQTLIPSGGVGPYRFSIVGQLPLGLSMSSDGRIAGLPQFADNESFDIQISDSRANTIHQSCTIAVSDQAVKISTACPLPRATTGSPYSAALTAISGYEPYTWSVSGTLPPGLTLGAGNRVSGVPMAAGPYTFRLVATDSTGQQSGVACSISVANGPLGISGCPLPEATVGDNYQAAVRPAGGSQPFVWTLIGDLPAGLQLTDSGVVQGKVTAAGTFQFNLGLRDQSMMSVAVPCSIKINPLALRVSTVGPATSGKIGLPYSMQFSAVGGTPPYRFDFFGYLPEGLTGSSNGTVTGTPTKVGTTGFGIRVTDARGTTAESVSSIEVGVPRLPTIKISSLPATVPAASTDVKIGVELDQVYTLPITGQLVLSLSPDTKNLLSNANQPDPHVRFTNGQLISAFVIPPGAKRVDIALASTGTVATTMTVSVRNLQAGGVDFVGTVSPQTFSVRAVPPVVNSACFVRTDNGIQITALGSSTTRELINGEVGDGHLTRSTDLNGVSSDYFSSDATIRFGGAFTVQFDADSAFKDSLGPFTVRLANTAGWSPVLTAQKCR